jgi:S1 RNA binding domain protein
MQLEIGKIVEGKVTGITKFGAFVELEPGKSGMVHISEVANHFVNDISDVLTVGQTVNTKIMSIADDGKIALSIKKAESPQSNDSFGRYRTPQNQGGRSGFDSNRGGDRGGDIRGGDRGGDSRSGDNDDGGRGDGRGFDGGRGGYNSRGFDGGRGGYNKRGMNKGPATFEDMMSAFKKSSEEKLGDIKRQGDKRGGRR